MCELGHSVTRQIKRPADTLCLDCVRVGELVTCNKHRFGEIVTRLRREMISDVCELLLEDCRAISKQSDGKVTAGNVLIEMIAQRAVEKGMGFDEGLTHSIANNDLGCWFPQ